MENTATSSQISRNLVAYFILTFAISWGIEIPIVLAQQGVIRPIFPPWFHCLAAYGPMLSALIVTGSTQGQERVRELWVRMTQWRVGALGWLVALSPVVLGLAGALAMNFLTTTKTSLADLGVVQFLPPLGIGALFLWVLTFGFGEETGWRGYALPRLQKNHNALYATTILTFFWALWHLPQFFYLFDPAIAIGWAIGLYAGAIVFTWLLNSTQGSILLAAVFHGCFNYVTSSNAGGGLLAAIVSTIVMIGAVVVVIVYKPNTLSRKDRFIIE